MFFATFKVKALAGIAVTVADRWSVVIAVRRCASSAIRGY